MLPLVEHTTLRVHSQDLNRLSFVDGDAVTVTSANGSFPAIVTADDTVISGTMVVPFGTRTIFGDNVQRFLVDTKHLSTQVRLTSR